MGNSKNAISAEAVVRATDKTWDMWFAWLDEQDGISRTHKEIVELINKSGDIDAWWQQAITVEYEKACGLRKTHEMPDGFQISKNKTIAAGASALFQAWADEAFRKTWLDDADFRIRKSTEPKTLRITWVDGRSDVNVSFYPKNDKTQVSINHSKLLDEKSAAGMKAYWSRQLEQLAKIFS